MLEKEVYNSTCLLVSSRNFETNLLYNWHQVRGDILPSFSRIQFLVDTYSADGNCQDSSPILCLNASNSQLSPFSLGTPALHCTPCTPSTMILRSAKRKLCLYFLTFLIASLIGRATASLGDHLPDFKECVKVSFPSITTPGSLKTANSL
jgi:hypothetical protein